MVDIWAVRYQGHWGVTFISDRAKMWMRLHEAFNEFPSESLIYMNEQDYHDLLHHLDGTPFILHEDTEQLH